jgi:nucleoside-diphosphate-sugar epimerase
MASDLRIVVTGGSGKAGRWVVRNLRAAGHDVLNVDVAHDGTAHGQTVLADLTDLGRCHEVVAGADAVVHLAAIPAPEIKPAGETFRNNALSTFNVFAASADRGVGRVVWASSETVLGLPSTIRRPTPRSTSATRNGRRRPDVEPLRDHADAAAQPDSLWEAVRR